MHLIVCSRSVKSRQHFQDKKLLLAGEELNLDLPLYMEYENYKGISVDLQVNFWSTVAQLVER